MAKAKALRAGECAKVKPSFIALICLGGGGSWARDADPETAVKRAVRIAKQDWKHLFKFEKGKTIMVNVFDVTGRGGPEGELIVGDDGVIDCSKVKEGERIPRLRLDEVVM